MNTILLNGREMTNKKDAHLYIKRKLDLPDYYGENLDGLWDLLTTVSGSMKIVIFNKKSIIENLGEYGHSLINIFQESAAENKNIEFKITDIRRIK